jgi:hypothetical protein
MGVGTLGAVAALNNNPQVVIRQLQSVSGNQSAIIRNNPSATIQPQQSAIIRNNPSATIRNNPQQSATIQPQQSAIIRNNPQQSIRNNPQQSATIHPQSSIRNNPSATNPSSFQSASAARS